ncbi:collagen alpha-1(IV) chain isoform X4 [Fopius arisanus]|uniref:Collagen alpha-1(IV) chain isoform X4 n=1 Tax=Fopius arisanus TaxID=64838 RepID=A0A9R1THD3_9HYME|nr:PREDICTED: collagen alpha-1(IV) chain-like isoform X4 [Fopius arisanus]
MRLRPQLLVLFTVGCALAAPRASKLKSTVKHVEPSPSAAVKAPVPAVDAEKSDVKKGNRAKKQTTTFCVEVKPGQNVKTDCPPGNQSPSGSPGSSGSPGISGFPGISGSSGSPGSPGSPGLPGLSFNSGSGTFTIFSPGLSGSTGQPGVGQPGVGSPGSPELVYNPASGTFTIAPPNGSGSIGQPGIGSPGSPELVYDPASGTFIIVPPHLSGSIGQPGVGQPGVGQPGTGQPGTGQPGTGQPGVGQPGTGQPVSGQPGSGQPGVIYYPKVIQSPEDQQPSSAPGGSPGINYIPDPSRPQDHSGNPGGVIYPGFPGIPGVQWTQGTPGVQWSKGTPGVQWNQGTPGVQWNQGTPGSPATASGCPPCPPCPLCSGNSLEYPPLLTIYRQAIDRQRAMINSALNSRMSMTAGLTPKNSGVTWNSTSGIDIKGPGGASNSAGGIELKITSGVDSKNPGVNTSDKGITATAGVNSGTPGVTITSGNGITPTAGVNIGIPGVAITSGHGLTPTAGVNIGTPGLTITSGHGLTPTAGVNIGTPGVSITSGNGMTATAGLNLGTPGVVMSTTTGVNPGSSRVFMTPTNELDPRNSGVFMSPMARVHIRSPGVGMTGMDPRGSGIVMNSVGGPVDPNQPYTIKYTTQVLSSSGQPMSHESHVVSETDGKNSSKSLIIPQVQERCQEHQSQPMVYPPQAHTYKFGVDGRAKQWVRSTDQNEESGDADVAHQDTEGGINEGSGNPAPSPMRTAGAGRPLRDENDESTVQMSIIGPGGRSLPHQPKGEAQQAVDKREELAKRQANPSANNIK